MHHRSPTKGTTVNTQQRIAQSQSAATGFCALFSRLFTAKGTTTPSPTQVLQQTPGGKLNPTGSTITPEAQLTICCAPTGILPQTASSLPTGVNFTAQTGQARPKLSPSTPMTHPRKARA
jgi:hypothetical protein